LVKRTAGKLIQSLGAVGESVETSLTGGDTYTNTDAAWTMFQDIGQSLLDYSPMSSRNSRPMLTNTAIWKNEGKVYQVDFDNDGSIQAIRDEKGYVVTNPFSETELEEVKKLKPTTRINTAGAIYKTADVIADLGVQVALTRGATNLYTKAGLTKKAASRAGVVSATVGTMTGPLLAEGKELFPDDPRKAALYALGASMGIGVMSNMFGLESRLAGGPGGYLDDLGRGRAAKMKNLAKGRTGTRAAINVGAARAVDVATSGLGEAVEETLGESLVKSAVKLTLNAKPREDDGTINWNEVGETAAISFVVGMLGGGVNVSSELRESALLVAAQNSTKYGQLLNEYIDQGIIPFDKDSANYEQRREKYVADEQARTRENRIVRRNGDAA
jgi:hypothetical protein